jgi:hypothetical protein
VLLKGDRFFVDNEEWELLTSGQPCPFCDGEYAAAAGPDDLGVWHTTPYCEQFENLTADRFMEAARVRRDGGAN